ncbi:MAG TPA: hypothetical protein VHZ50_09025 [Puia sp.]|jgi:hypothetical protein|nr:hypothetical protein [Puia sp.]
MNPYCIFINTTDSFEDCWLPFFKTFSAYWPDFNGTIFLNTEKKDFGFENLNIVSVKNANNNSCTATWSACLLNGLQKVGSEILLYMQEDYFLRAPVDNKLIHDHALLMLDEDIDCIHLTDQHSAGPFKPSPYPGLWMLSKNADHRISCQAALWKKDILIKYIRAHENPWQFELYGTLRARCMDHKFYTVNLNRHKLHCKEIIPYIFTGVIQGKWYEEVIELFAQHHIEIDFSGRGFITDKERFALLPRIKRKMKDINAKSILEIFKMKLSGSPQ